MGNTRALWGVPEYIKYYEEKDGVISCGRGFYDALIRYLANHNIVPEIIDKRVKVPLFEPFKCDMTLRDYQEGVVEAIAKHENGIVHCDTGWGKSYLMLKIIESFQQSTLIIVPADHLLQQLKNDLKKVCNIEAGIIQGKKREIKDVSLATIQTLDKMKVSGELEIYKDRWGMVLTDEIHLFLTKKRLAAIQTFDANYFYGFSATLTHEGQQQGALKFTWGSVLYRGEIPQMKPEIHIYETESVIPVRQYSIMIEQMVEDQKRNKFIVGVIKNEMENGRKILVLTKRVAHINLIKQLLPDSDKIISLYADEKKTIKSELLSGLRQGTIEFDVLLGTAPFLAVGSDCPRINCVMFVADFKSHTLCTQAIGRSLRLLKGKPRPLIVDFTDSANGILRSQSKYRQKLYKEKGFSIVTCN